MLPNNVNNFFLAPPIRPWFNCEMESDESDYVAVLECSDGNETVGDMWVETHVCTPATTIAELMDWKKTHPNGKRLSITKAT